MNTYIEYGLTTTVVVVVIIIIILFYLFNIVLDIRFNLFNISIVVKDRTINSFHIFHISKHAMKHVI